MNLDSVVAVGYRPWLPSARACELDVWDRYDVPTVGTFRCDTHTVFFSMVEEPSGSLTVWGYVPLTEAEADFLQSEELEDEIAFGKEVDVLFSRKPCVYGLAEDYAISRWGVTGGPKTGLLDGAADFLSSLATAFNNESHSLRRRAEEFHEVEAYA